ncbi:hypothetical protein OG625_12515 [Streptomyces sp. NBC_01351]|uniref:hypothetical protein n=1 Tax=Streptomyces sp. NBC_01351 TaxID=2903833 RepID=UPI002E3644AB|nr:hypothetical protein [Streptomyces sp. NBC_01351]
MSRAITDGPVLPAATETPGLGPAATAVIETDGSTEQADSLKSAYEGAAARGMPLDSHSFDRLPGHPDRPARETPRGAS